MPTLEDKAREQIDKALERAGWKVQDYKQRQSASRRRRGPSKFSSRERARVRRLSPIYRRQGRRSH